MAERAEHAEHAAANSAPASSAPLHGEGPPSAWVQRWAHLLGPNASALDVAAGRGRHTRWLQSQGHRVLAVDRDAQALAAIDTLNFQNPAVSTLVADLETGPWPFEGQTFDAIVVTNYLWRPLLPILAQSLSPGGVFIYETFAAGNESVGKPSRPDFLLRPGELLEVCRGLRIVAFEDGYLAAPERFVQRIVAVHQSPKPDNATGPARYRLA